MVALLEKDVDPRPYLALGRRIAEARRAANISQRKLAELVDINEGYPPRIEGGRARPDPLILRHIARVLHVDYAELAILAGYLPPQPSGDIERVEVSRDDASLTRRFAGLPRRLKLRALRFVDMFSEDVPLEDAVEPSEDVQERGSGTDDVTDDHAGREEADG